MSRGLLRRCRGDRGVTVVEYALGLSLTLVVMLGGIQFVQTEGTDHLETQGDTIGTPAGDSEGWLPNDVGAGPGAPGDDEDDEGTDPDDVGDTPVQVSTVGGSYTQGSPDVSKWNAVAVIKIVDSSGVGVAGVRLDASWQPAGNSGTTSTGTFCVSDASGNCTLVRQNITDNKKTVSFSITSIDSVDTVWVPDNNDPEGATITCGTPAC